MRLTEKTKNGFYELKAGEEIYGEERGIRLVQVLGQYEDIEELCEKIASQPIYKKYIDDGEIHEEDYIGEYVLYDFETRRIYIYGYEFVDRLALADYGKTWALTKEELL